ncbi:MAG: PQQ-binding-like beta-propeller repeat protein [Thaumarchaeota archaeon]|nr:PQQ-binding-like beta-propeller repeat protein [Nitrososphaerota archaeon]
MKAVRLIAVTIIILLLAVMVSSPASNQVFAQVDGKDWPKINYDSRASNYNPQAQITKDNVAQLEIKWIYALPKPPAFVGGYATGGQGEVSTPLVVNGVIYWYSGYGSLVAIDAKKGKVLWTYTFELDYNADVKKGLPIRRLSSLNHIHGFNYFDGKLFLPTPPCDLHIVDASTGKLIRKIESTCRAGPSEGNVGFYKGAQSYGPTIYEKEGILIASAGSVDETNNGGRGFFAGYSIDTGQELWRFYVLPQGGGDRDWALKVADKGWIDGIRAGTLPRESLLNDWGEAGAKGSQAGPSRSQWAVDEETGIAYVATTHSAPASNGTHRPGPNVFAASIIALKATTGELAWWHQVVPHDLSDWDCNWNVILGKVRVQGVDRKLIFKGCKDGKMQAFDAANGERVWVFDPPTVRRCEVCVLRDARDPAQLKKRWSNEPSTEPFLKNPRGGGGLEADIAFTGDTVFFGSYNFWDYIRVVPVEPNRITEGGSSVPLPEIRESNTTIFALDASTGRVKWTYFIDSVGYRTSIVASGGLVYLVSTNGNLYALDARTGREVWIKYFGVGLLIHPVIAADSDGKMMMLIAFGGQKTLLGRVTPGMLIAMSLPDKALKKNNLPISNPASILKIGADLVDN